MTTAWKRAGNESTDITKARETVLEEDLTKNVSLSLHDSCYRIRAEVKMLLNHAVRLRG